MTRAEILALDLKWEEWIVVDDVPYAFRALINLPNKGISKKSVLIVRVGLGVHPITSWNLAPWDLIDGKQSRPEGKHTKRMRAWFFELFGVQLPFQGPWGQIDSSYDPHNQSTTVVCNYR